MPQPSTDHTQWSLTTKLLPPLQFLWKLLENSQRNTQSRVSPPPHHLKFISIKHCHFRSDQGAATIHQLHQLIPHCHVFASSLIPVKITWREDTLNQARAFPHTSQNSSWLDNAISEAIVALPPSTNNVKRLLVTPILTEITRQLIKNDRNCDVLPKTSNIHSRRMVLLHGGGADDNGKRREWASDDKAA